MTNDLISIIVPVYNVEKYLERCVGSLINQTYQNIEIILVDDCSTDSSGELCDTLSKKDDRIKVVHKPVNEGLGYTRNTGIENARGDYLMLVDSDDYIDLNTCKKTLTALKENEADICCHLCAGVYLNETVYNNPFEEPLVFEGEEVVSKFLASCIAPNQSSLVNEYGVGLTANMCIYKADIIKNNSLKFYSERDFVNEDMLFKLELFRYISKVVVLPDNFYYYYHNNASLSASYRSDRFDSSIAMYIKANELCSALNCEELFRRNIRYFMINTMVCVKQEVASKGSAGISKIKEICKNETLKNALSQYPLDSLPLQQRLFFKSIKSNRWAAVFCLTKIKLISDKKKLS